MRDYNRLVEAMGVHDFRGFLGTQVFHGILELLTSVMIPRCCIYRRFSYPQLNYNFTCT